MKPFILFKYLILLILSLMLNQSKASEPDSLQPQESGIDLYAIGGLGMSTGSAGGGWEEYFYNGPAIAVGLEIPFTSSHTFALQLYGHKWVSKYNRKYPINSYNEDYVNVSGDYYSVMYLSAYFKYYLYLKSDKLSFSLHFGGTILSQTYRVSSIQYGIGLNLKLTQNSMISLMRRLNVPRLDVGGGSGANVPDYLMLEFSYKLF